MSDKAVGTTTEAVRVERRANTQEILDRMARLEVVTQDTKEEVERVRVRMHDSNGVIQMLVDATERLDANGIERGQKMDALTQEVARSALASARSEATIGVTMAAHIEQCKTDKADIKAMHVASARKQDESTAEVRSTLLQIGNRVAKLETRMAIYVGAILILGQFAIPYVIPLLKLIIN